MNFWTIHAVQFAVLLAITLFSPRASFGQSPESSDQAYSSSIVAIAKRAAGDFSPDGNLSKQVWKRAKWVEFDHDVSGKSNHPNAATHVSAVWTDQSVYFAFWCRYDSLNVYEGEDVAKERWELWNRDVAEVFLNPQPERITHYYEFEVAPNNQWIDLEIEKKNNPFNDASWNSGFEHATRIDSANHVWTAEIRIPLAAMNAKSIHPSTTWRVNFFRAAGQGGDDRRMFLAWSTIPNGKTFHVPERFGILRFTK
jgi:hypothetical protein